MSKEILFLPHEHQAPPHQPQPHYHRDTLSKPPVLTACISTPARSCTYTTERPNVSRPLGVLVAKAGIGPLRR